MKILDNYITQLIENSTPQEPAWNIEKIRAGKPNTWNYIDGCMIKALLSIYDITEDARYLNFADEFIDYFVNEDGTIKYYDPEEYNLDNVNAGKTLYRLYDLRRCMSEAVYCYARHEIKIILTLIVCKPWTLALYKYEIVTAVCIHYMIFHFILLLYIL